MFEFEFFWDLHLTFLPYVCFYLFDVLEGGKRKVKSHGNLFEFASFSSDDESWEQKKRHLAEKRSKRGIPPVSPNACIKDAVASEVFDCIWSNVIGILEELIKKNWETSITGIWYF